MIINWNQISEKSPKNNPFLETFLKYFIAKKWVINALSAWATKKISTESSTCKTECRVSMTWCRWIVTHPQADKLPIKASEKAREASSDPKTSKLWCRASTYTIPRKTVVNTLYIRVPRKCQVAAHSIIIVDRGLLCHRVSSMPTMGCSTPIR